jgi:hypothetical protein
MDLELCTAACVFGKTLKNKKVILTWYLLSSSSNNLSTVGYRFVGALDA